MAYTQLAPPPPAARRRPSGPGRRGVLLASALGLVLFATGCPSVQFAGAPRSEGPNRPEVTIECVVDGLAHRPELCSLEFQTDGYYAEVVGVPGLDPRLGGPQRVDVTASEWAEQRDLNAPVAAGQIRVRFYWNKSALMAERLFPAPRFDPEAEVGAEDVDDPPRPPDDDDDPPRPPDDDPPPPPSRPAFPDPISTSLRRPTPVELDDEAEITCGLTSPDGAQPGPMYAQLHTEPCRLRLVVDIKSLDAAEADSDPTWWSVDLLDGDGLEISEDLQYLGYIESGDEIRTVLYWAIDSHEKPPILKVNCGRKGGGARLAVNLTLIREPDSLLGPR